MTKKDYETIAAGILEALDEWQAEDRSHERVGIQTAANRISRRLAQAYPAFDRNKFLAACGL